MSKITIRSIYDDYMEDERLEWTDYLDPYDHYRVSFLEYTILEFCDWIDRIKQIILKRAKKRRVFISDDSPIDLSGLPRASSLSEQRLFSHPDFKG